ncbi:TldD/PmbA family protein [Kosmotoga pacifica]|uniref:Zn-dependent protease n=1 Tax=Kosmotoga pacifica TaxID=1330330 RepID=A0A0G2ZFB9_9BACT|nr:TldD/PmbA family protein [Kosmotoga pacifica]AKI97463.1 hypothetical protein IX53_06110 [Kosmotoga pacifica]
MLDFLKSVLLETKFPILLKYQRRTIRAFRVENGVLKEASIRNLSGISIRVWNRGIWGFSSTGIMTKGAVEKAIKSAMEAVKGFEGKSQYHTPSFNPAKGDFRVTETDSVALHSVEEKIDLVMRTADIAKKSEKIVSSLSFYSEIVDEKYFLSNYGTEASYHDVKVDFGVMAYASDGNRMEMGFKTTGATGGWGELFRRNEPDFLAEEAARVAIEKLGCNVPEGGIYTVILHPSLVGVLAHEAIGHTVEADLVISGSAAKGKIGEKVASELVTLVDDPDPEIEKGASGILLVDDEGNLPQKVKIIENGVMKSYLHDSETAGMFSVSPTGNARAFNYSDEPIIRMRNTYIAPGEQTLDEMISATRKGFYLKELGGGGQADANAEFMFGVQEAYRIENGKLKEPVKGITISGQAFDVLRSVDMVGNDFQFALGSGYCGKHQPAKVDAGGPHIRCKVKIGGKKA